ncbi:hypothetical protein GCM10012275_11900 [Longimycelium tulufanense]|uniref:Uncharacterized protein n=1 Tax=Longimycelium tulufanense TaxID=907463 RepID=A0A8J3C6P6_9PSEU|nr:hypothetical protein GCM10012275_11900 [Longimycelium tulufanense]
MTRRTAHDSRPLPTPAQHDGRSFDVARLLTNLRFWVLTVCVAWVTAVIVMIHNQQP